MKAMKSIKTPIDEHHVIETIKYGDETIYKPYYVIPTTKELVAYEENGRAAAFSSWNYPTRGLAYSAMLKFIREVDNVSRTK